MNRAKAILLSVLLLAMAGQAMAQFIDRENGNIYNLYPQKIESPAFQYTLLPNVLDKRRGNAAVHYGKVTAEQGVFFNDVGRQNAIADLLELPLDVVRESDFATEACPQSVYRILREAALCDLCDWELPIGHVPFDELIFVEVQQTRNFARILAAKARYQIANGDFVDAIETLQTGYALARNVNTSPTLVHHLVAIAIKTIMDRQLESFIQQPDAPNLYWAIAKLPDPFLPMRDAIATESRFPELSFPVLRDLNVDNVGDHTDDYWKKQIERILVASQALKSPALNQNADHSQQAEKIIKSNFKLAQRILLGSGLSPVEIKRLSPTQSIVLGAMRDFRIKNERVAKWTCLPYHQAANEMERERGQLENASSILGLSEVLTPAYQQLFAATARSDRQTTLLQTLEAIRAFAAANAARLPENVGELTLTPAPFDPVSGKPFETKLEDETLSIFGPRLPSGSLDVRVKIIQE